MVVAKRKKICKQHCHVGNGLQFSRNNPFIRANVMVCERNLGAMPQLECWKTGMMGEKEFYPF